MRIFCLRVLRKRGGGARIWEGMESSSSFARPGVLASNISCVYARLCYYKKMCTHRGSIMCECVPVSPLVTQVLPCNSRCPLRCCLHIAQATRRIIITADAVIQRKTPDWLISIMTVTMYNPVCSSHHHTRLSLPSRAKFSDTATNKAAQSTLGPHLS